MNHLPAFGLAYRRGVAAFAVAALAAIVSACGGGAARGTEQATDAEWRALASPRPTPLPGAVRLAIGELELLGEAPWSLVSGVPPALGLSELVVAGLLRRRNIHFVERRRFAAAAAAERSGARRPGAPAAGVSPGAELVAGVVWLSLGPGQSSLEMRLSNPETGAIVRTWRTLVPSDADLVTLARTIVASLLGGLDALGRLPVWSDPIAAAAPADYVASNVPDAAVEDFLEGLRAEEVWNWEGARRAYVAAAQSVGFFEASVALARTARLRVGGTLGES